MPEVSERQSAERAMIRALLSEKRWNRGALRAKLGHLDRETFDDTFASLVCNGVADADRDDVQACRQLRHLAALGVLNLDPAPRNGAPGADVIDRIISRSAERRQA